jgi:putative peptide zinc metalloprotease protein
MRLDGYWVLADLTGVPDFLSHMGAFLRSLVPWRREATSSRQLPALKPWARLVFGLYILLAVPLLLLQIGLMLRGMPRVLATAWDSAGRQVASMGQTMAAGDSGSTLLAVLQLVALALPTLAVLLALVRVGKQIARGLWRWSSASPVRGVLGALVAVGLVAFLGYAWLPAPSADPDRPAVTWSGQAQYAPILREERGTVGDLVAGVVATRPPAEADATPAPTAMPAATSPVTPAPTLDPTPVPTVLTTPQPKPGLIGSPTAALALSPSARTPLPTVVRTPTPLTGP